MKRNKLLYFFCSILLVLAVSALHAEYIEGTDTTDESGNGLDGAFRVVNGHITGKVIAYYCFDPGMCRGYFNYTFEDITIAPDTIRDSTSTNFLFCDKFPSHCFVCKDTLRHTYAKVIILSHLDGKRYEYRFGKNTVADNRTLTSNSTSINIRKKVSNLFYTGIPYFMHTDPEHYQFYSKMISWDTPLDTINFKAIKFIFYQAKSTIDTTVPINKAQWQPIELLRSPSNIVIERFRYFNFVIVYNNRDTSDFLSGWTMGTEGPIAIRQNNHKLSSLPGEIAIRKSNNRLLVDYSKTAISAVASLYLFNLAGKRVAGLTSMDNNTFSNTSQQELKNGSYILQAILKDGGSITSLFTLTQ